jgi:hypothetical protein
MVVWQVAVGATLLNSEVKNGFLSLDYPLKNAQELSIFIDKMPRRAFDKSGGCVLRKSFEVVYPAADVLIYGTRVEDHLRCVDNCLFLCSCLLNHPRIDQAQNDLIQQRVDKLEQHT